MSRLPILYAGAWVSGTGRPDKVPIGIVLGLQYTARVTYHLEFQ